MFTDVSTRSSKGNIEKSIKIKEFNKQEQLQTVQSKGDS